MASNSGGSSAPRLILVAAMASVTLFVGSLIGVAAILGASPGCGEGGSVGSLSPQVPKELVPIYYEAAARYDLGPRGASILAAINYVETSFGTNLGESSAGAEGWMQFLPSSWASYGVDGDGDGDKDPDDPWDAIFAAANLLHADGAPGDWYGAIYDYNHADWYVEEVLEHAQHFAAGAHDAEAAPVEEGPSCSAIAAPNEAVGAMVQEAERLSILRPHTEYVWGGSHGITPTPPNGPFDCSSAVSHLLQVGGFKIETTDTVGLSTWGEPGPGQWVTIWVKPYDDAAGAAHTFLEFMPGVTPPGKRYWGTSGFIAGHHGPGWIPETTFDPSYLAGFQQRHPPGL